MKKIFLFLSFLIPLFLFSETRTEPLTNDFEAKVFARIAKAESDAEKKKIAAEAVSDKRTGAALYFNAANMYAQNSEFGKAEELYIKALGAMPNFYLAHRNLAYLYYNNGDYRKAIPEFASALALSGTDAPKIFRAYAFSLMELRLYDESLSSIEKAIMYAPEDESLLRAKARLLYETGQEERLYKFAESMLARYPREPLYWRMLARLDLAGDRLHDAAASIESMKSLGIAAPEDMELLGDVYLRMEFFEKAENSYKGLEIKAQKLYVIAKYFAIKGAKGEAEKIAVRLDKNSAEYLEVDAILKDSKEAFEKAYAKAPTNAFLALKLAGFYQNEKRFDAAKIFYQQSVKEFRQQSLWGIACVNVEEGDYLAAAEKMEEIAAEFGREDLNGYIIKLKEYAGKK